MISTPDNPKCHPIEQESKQKSDEPIQPMTYNECIIKMDARGDVGDPQALCSWMKQNLPGAIKKESKRELQQQTNKIESQFLRGLHSLISKELLSELNKLKDAEQEIENRSTYGSDLSKLLKQKSYWERELSF